MTHATKKRNRSAKPKQPPTQRTPRLALSGLPRFAPGSGNPVWGDSFVTRSAFTNWSNEIPETDADIPKLPLLEGPFTLSAGPLVRIDLNGFRPPAITGVRRNWRRREDNDPRNRVSVSLGELAGGPGEGQDLNLEVKFSCPMLGTQIASGPITIEQALSFEEGVRAVFEAARQFGLLPAPKARKRAKEG